MQYGVRPYEKIPKRPQSTLQPPFSSLTSFVRLLDGALLGSPPPRVVWFSESYCLPWVAKRASALNASCLSWGVPLPCLVENAAGSHFPNCLRPRFMVIPPRRSVQFFGFSPSQCVQHRASLSRPLCSSLVPDSSSSEAFLARPPCCRCFVTCGERLSAQGLAWTFVHSFPRVLLGAFAC